MRLDKFLKVSRILKRRTVATEACQSDKVRVNGHISKPSKQLAVGDILEISFGQNTIKLEILNLKDSTRKADAAEMYKILATTPTIPKDESIDNI
ncbi:MAG: RNA-binding S4 domain-containing protein [Clostridiales bacterium]|jgi:ribosomal 50S subunit-recycling heat shock protein|nr:RNA-binding S4 domain-containing protein [Clostridiales bacterium]